MFRLFGSSSNPRRAQSNREAAYNTLRPFHPDQPLFAPAGGLPTEESSRKPRRHQHRRRDNTQPFTPHSGYSDRYPANVVPPASVGGQSGPYHSPHLAPWTSSNISIEDLDEDTPPNDGNVEEVKNNEDLYSDDRPTPVCEEEIADTFGSGDDTGTTASGDQTNGNEKTYFDNVPLQAFVESASEDESSSATSAGYTTPTCCNVCPNSPVTVPVPPRWNIAVNDPNGGDQNGDENRSQSSETTDFVPSEACTSSNRDDHAANAPPRVRNHPRFQEYLQLITHIEQYGWKHPRAKPYIAALHNICEEMLWAGPFAPRTYDSPDNCPVHANRSAGSLRLKEVCTCWLRGEGQSRDRREGRGRRKRGGFGENIESRETAGHCGAWNVRAGRW